MSNLNWEYIQNNPKIIKRLLGIEYEQLIQLMELGKKLNKEHQKKLEIEKRRLIKKGGGKPPKLSEENQIILTLIYLRHHLSFQLLGLTFGVSESTANDLFNYWLKILRYGLPASLLEQVKKSEQLINEVQEKLTEYELIVDSEEQPIARAEDYQEQKKFSEGKKKNHTFKNQIITLPNGNEIVDVVTGKPGPTSDIKICREVLYKFDNKQQFIGDKAYVGETQIKTPDKKPKKGELTELQKQVNKELSSNRIFVEHLIRIIKIWRAAQERFRLNKSKYVDVFLTICGLVRLRIGALKLEIVKSADCQEVIYILLTHTFGSKMDFQENLTN